MLITIMKYILMTVLCRKCEKQRRKLYREHFILLKTVKYNFWIHKDVVKAFL